MNELLAFIGFCVLLGPPMVWLIDVIDSAAIAIEARRAETSGSVEDESAGRKASPSLSPITEPGREG